MFSYINRRVKKVIASLIRVWGFVRLWEWRSGKIDAFGDFFDFEFRGGEVVF